MLRLTHTMQDLYGKLLLTLFSEAKAFRHGAPWHTLHDFNVLDGGILGMVDTLAAQISKCLHIHYL